jgi:hypothetical protein
MALFRVMTVCVRVDAAVEYCLRHALKDHGATFPHQKGKPGQNPTALWVFHDFGGMPRLLIPQQWPIVVNLPEAPQHLLQRLGDRSAGRYR